MKNQVERAFSRLLRKRPGFYPFGVFWLGVGSSWLFAIGGFYYIYLQVSASRGEFIRVLPVFVGLLILVTVLHRVFRAKELRRMVAMGSVPPPRTWTPEAAEDFRLALSFPGSFTLSTFLFAELVVALLLVATLVLYPKLDPGHFQFSILVGGQIATSAAVLVGYSVLDLALVPLKSRFPPIENPELVAKLPRILGYKSRILGGMLVLLVITSALVGSLIYREFDELHPMPPSLDAESLAPQLLVIAIFTLGFGALLALTASGIATRLIQNSLETLNRLEAGDLGARAAVISAGDLGQLSANLNSMAGRMQKTITDLQESRSALEDAERRRADLVANLTHDIRSPVSTILASSELGELEARSAGAHALERHFFLIRRNAKRVADLATNIVDMEQLERSELQLELGYVDIGQLADELTSSMASLVVDRDITLRAQIPASLQTLLTDREKLLRILDNLLANAIRVTKEGWVEIGAEAMPGSRVAISVSDSGPGIAPEALGRIFEPRFQVPGVPRGGAGLGLTISRKFAALLGGRLRVESVVGKGTTFVVELPVEGPPSKEETKSSEPDA